LTGLVELIHQKLGNTPEDAKILSYDPKDYGDWEGKDVQVVLVVRPL
jgi:hypothetical protein